MIRERLSAHPLLPLPSPSPIPPPPQAICSNLTLSSPSRAMSLPSSTILTSASAKTCFVQDEGMRFPWGTGGSTCCGGCHRRCDCPGRGKADCVRARGKRAGRLRAVETRKEDRRNQPFRGYEDRSHACKQKPVLAPPMGTRGSARMRPCFGEAAAHSYNRVQSEPVGRDQSCPLIVRRRTSLR